MLSTLDVQPSCSGEDKTCQDDWYECVPLADRLYDRHLEEIEKDPRNG